MDLDTVRWEGTSLVIETVREIQGMTITTKEVRTLDATGKEMTIEAVTQTPQGDPTARAEQSGELEVRH
jgi:hypothetical protein